MMKRFCANCGKEMMVEHPNTRYCDECKVIIKAEWKEKQKAIAKERNERLGLVTVSLYKDTREVLKAIASQKGISVADVVRDMIAASSNKTVDKEEPAKPKTDKKKK